MNEKQSSNKKNGARDKSRSLFKVCPRCKKKSKVQIIKQTKKLNRVSAFLLKVLSPGGTNINQRYKCPRCTHEFDDMSFTEAVIIPMVFIGIVVLSVILFLIFVFYSVAK